MPAFEYVGVGERRCRSDRRRRRLLVHECSDAEVDDLRRPEAGHQDVLRLEVEVQYPALMCMFQRIGQGDAELEHIGWGERPLPVEAIAQRPAADHLHDDVRLLTRRETRRVHHADVGVPRQRPHRSAFPVEAPSGGIVVDSAEDLDGDLSAVRIVGCSVHRSETAAAEHSGGGEPLDLERHRRERTQSAWRSAMSSTNPIMAETEITVPRRAARRVRPASDGGSVPGRRARKRGRAPANGRRPPRARRRPRAAPRARTAPAR